MEGESGRRYGAPPAQSAMLGRCLWNSALLTNLSPNLQSISRARIRLSNVYSLTAFIRLHAVLGALTSKKPSI